MNWQTVTDAFEKARSRPRGERADFLREYCAGDDELLREAESLLTAHDEAGEFLQDSAVAHSGQKVLDAISGAMIGVRLGAFQITRLIGEGGMGEVYEAERADGEFRQRVAIKIVREDWADRRRHDRLRAERQILSDLSHPHIARLLDGGATATGAPYLVMELIDGEPVDSYCDSHGLDLAQRLELFGRVCDAVEYANRQNVVHCDLKPGNILVTADGTPKLLDFGISRLLSPGAQTTQTCVATPEYASPEQLAGQKVTAATDVYALGVILRKIGGGEPGLSAVIDRATRQQPLERYPSAAALGHAAQKSASKRWSRRGVIAAVAGGVTLLGAGGLTWRRFRPSVMARSDALAVMRIENRTGNKALDWTDRGIADLLATNFTQAGVFEVISTSRSRELLERLGNDQRRAAEAAHAAYYVTGDLMRLGQGLRLNLRVEQTSSGQIQFAEKFDAASPQAIAWLADRSSSAILSQLRASTYAAPSTARTLSSNAEALRHYEVGCDYRERLRLPEARDSFSRAIQLDRKFAMAYYRLGTSDLDNIPTSLRDLERAVELGKEFQLPARDRQMMDGSLLFAYGRIEEAVAVWREAARQNPRDVEVRAQLARGLTIPDPSAGLTVAQEALAFDPHSRQALSIASGLAAATGRFPEAVTFAKRYIATLKRGDTNGYDTLGNVFGLAEQFDDAIAAYKKANRSWKDAVASIHKGDFDRAQALLKNRTDRRLGGGTNVGLCLGYMGDIQVALGNIEGARPLYLDSTHAYTDYQWLGGGILWNIAQGYLEQGQPDDLLEFTELHAGHSWAPGVRAVALLAMNKTTDAEGNLAAVHESVGARLGEYMGVRYEELYRILGAFYRGDYEKVATMADRAPVKLWNFFALAAGRANLVLGNLDAAERHLNFARRAQLSFESGLGEAHNFLGFLLGEFYLGRLALRRGREEEARRKFAFFLKHFSHSSAHLPQIAEARSALRT